MSFWWSPLAPPAAAGGAVDGDLTASIGEFTLSADATVAARPGSTLTAMQAGSFVGKWVASIYGYPYLLTDAPTGAAVSAWNGLDWTQDLGGLYVELENEQRLNPWQPFTAGGTLTLRVAPDAADTFGIDTHRKTAGAETFLDDTTGVDDTPITVKSTSAFSSSGTVYIGTESIGYASKTGTTFAGCTRGKFAPFGTDSGTAGRFGQRHEVTTDADAIKLQPLVTAQPRAWIGKWVGLWLHRWSEQNQLLNTRANAQLTFAGRIVSIADDPSSGCTAVEVEHVLDCIKRATIGPDWTARLKEGIWLEAGMTFSFVDTGNEGTTTNTANDLVVVPSGATAPNEINEGIYTAEDICSALSAWLANEEDVGRVVGFYHVALGPYGSSTGPTRTYFSYNIPGAGPTVAFKLTYPSRVARFLGNLADFVGGTGALLWGQSNSVPSTDYDRVSEKVPLRSMLSAEDNNGQPVIEVFDEQGTFVDQVGDLPAEAPTSGGGSIGLVMIKNSIFGVLKVGNRMSQIAAIGSIAIAGQQHGQGIYDFLGSQEATVDDPEGAPVIKQVLFYRNSFAEVIKRIFYTTNGEGYNHATYDVLPRQLGIGIPGELLGDSFEDSVDLTPGANADCIIVLDKPTKISDIFTGSLCFRWTFVRWINEHIELCNWRSPTTGDALTESNKAAPVGTDDEHRVSSVLSDDWQRQVIKVEYDRDVTALDFEGGFRSATTFKDPTAIDDANGATNPITLSLRDVYGVNGIEVLEGQFKSTATLFTRAVRIATRSMDSRFFEGHSVGDCVIVTDEFARDPDTGVRGVSARPGIIVRHQWSPGGLGPNGSVSDIGGEVDIMFLDLLRVATYVPTCQLDDTSTNSGYVVATKIATCYAHKFSESSESADASYFTTGRKIRLIELDPSNPASPSTHDDTVASQSGNTITLTTGFAGFDNTKKYKVVFDTYSDSTAEQQASFVYQADDVDGMIADTRAPFQYANGPLITGTANAANDEIELPADNTYGDGVGRDVGTESSVNRLINNLMDLKCAMSLPWITSEMSGTNGVSFALVEVRPVWLTAEQNNGVASRSLSVAPFIKSALGSSSVRVTLVRHRPVADSLNDIDRGPILSEATFTTSSSTYAIATAQSLDIGEIKGQSGTAYLLIECTPNARTYGLAVCQESERQ